MRIANWIWGLGAAVYAFAALGAAQLPLKGLDKSTKSNALASWSFQTHSPYVADLNGDGRDDLLLVSDYAGGVGGILLSNGDQPLQVVQTWGDDTFWAHWRLNSHKPVIGRFNRDRRDDIFLQGRQHSAHAIVITDADGTLSGPVRTIPKEHLGLKWGMESAGITVGDTDGDAISEIILQGLGANSRHAIVQLSTDGDDRVVQSWQDQYLGLSWDAEDSVLHTGDFNRDGRDDVLVQGDKNTGLALLLSNPDGTVSEISRSWPHDYLGAEWSNDSVQLHVADLNADGYADVVLRRLDGSTTQIIVADGDGEFSELSIQQKLSETDDRYTLSADGILVGDFSGTGWPQVIAGSGPERRLLQAGNDGRLTSSHPVVAPNRLNRKSTSRMPTDNAVGVTEGGFAVRHGVATYSIPLIVPPGRNGMEPGLSLSYSHTAGNGHMGVGWMLAGQSMISRCSATVATDDQYQTADLGGVTLTSKDRFCMDGRYLALTSGTSYGANPSSYRTELDSFVKVEPNFAAGGIIESFTAYTPDNRILTYGKARMSSVVAHDPSLKVVTWYLATVADRFGNEVRYTYSDGANASSGVAEERLLDSITYTHNGNDSMLRRVEFGYEAARTDGYDYYVAGTRMIVDSRLKTVQVKVDGALVRQYELFYQDPAQTATGRSRLEYVSECTYGGSDHTGAPVSEAECLPPTKFVWQGSTTGLSIGDIDDYYASGQSTNTEFGYDKVGLDFTGDGRVDFLDLRKNSSTPDVDITVWENSEDGLTEVEHTGLPIDFNVDVLRSSAGTLDYDDNGLVDHLVPYGDVLSLSRPLWVRGQDLEYETAVGTHALVGTVQNVEWLTAAGPVDHYQLGILENGTWTDSSTAPDNATSIIGPTFTFQDRGRQLSFGVRACASPGTSECTPYRQGPAFVVCFVSDGLECDPPGGGPTQETSSACLAPAGSANLAIVSQGASNLSFVELTNVKADIVGFNDPDGGVRYDSQSYFVMDVNGDGRRDIVTRDRNQWNRYIRSDDEAGSVPADELFIHDASFCPSAKDDRFAAVINYDADGRQDLLVERAVETVSGQGGQVTYDTDVQLFVYRSTETGIQPIDLGIDGEFPTTSGVPTGVTYSQPWVQPVVADFNADGLTDFIIARDNGTESSATRGNIHLYQNTGKGFDEIDTLIASPGTNGSTGMRLGYFISPVDFDGDGDMDILIPDVKDLTNDGHGPCVPDGSQINCGRDDMVSLNDGYSWRLSEYEFGNFTAPSTCGGSGCANMTLRGGMGVDVDGNGRYEYIGEAKRTMPNQLVPEPNPYVLSFDGNAPDLLSKIVVGDGKLNRETTITYQPLQSNSLSQVYSYTPTAAADGQPIDVAGTMHAVSSVETDSGIGGAPRVVTYQYENARSDKRGRGMLGFEVITSTDEERSIARRTVFHQEFPLVGLPDKVWTYTLPGTHETTELAVIDYDWTAKSTVNSAAAPYWTYPSEIVSQTFDLNTHALLGTTTRTIGTPTVEDVDAFGNVLKATSVIADAAGVPLQTIENVVDHSAATDTESTKWWIRQPVSRVTTYTSGASTLVNDVAYTYGPISRAVESVTVSPLDALREKLVDPIYTSSGLIQSVTRSAGPTVTNAFYKPAPQVVDPDYVSNVESYYPTSVSVRTDGSWPTTVSVSETHGRMESYRDPNSAVDSITNFFDGFGRIVRSVPVGRQPITTEFSWVPPVPQSGEIQVTCPINYSYVVTQRQANAPTMTLCLDMYHRVVRQAEMSFSGNVVYVDVTYDRLGRVASTSEPYFKGASTVYTSDVLYDVVDRPTTITRSDGVVTENIYSGLVVNTTVAGTATGDCTPYDNTGIQDCEISSSQTLNALGQVVQTTDAEGGLTSMTYDAYGNVNVITDAEGEQITFVYDDRNRLISVTDPNAGYKSFLYNTLDQLRRQTQSETSASTVKRFDEFEYDALGRMTDRKQKLTSGSFFNVGAWTYDQDPEGTAGAPYINRLGTVSGAGTYENASSAAPETIKMDYFYEANRGLVTRIDTLIAHADGSDTFSTSYVYDPLTAYLKSETHTDSDAVFSAPITIDYTYDAALGAFLVKETSNNFGDGSNALLREILTVNERGQVEEQKLGWDIGLYQSIQYQPETGQVADLCTATGTTCTGSGTVVHDVGRLFDAFSLPQIKTDAIQNITQTILERDQLGRLKKVDATGLTTPTTFSYDNVGNFLTKSDWSTDYQYEENPTPAKPYQVEKVTLLAGAGDIDYEYDEFGNLRSATGTQTSVHDYSAEYTFADKPEEVTRGGSTSAFRYGPTQQRFIQRTVTGNESVTTLYAGAFEKVSTRVAGTITEVVERIHIGDYLVHTRIEGDTDGDGVANSIDNCSLEANSDQFNANESGAGFDIYGNRCDPDFDENEIVDTIDLGLFRANYNSGDPEYDLNNDGAINPQDLGILGSYFGEPPGPTGLVLSNRFLLRDELGSINSIVDVKGNVLSRFSYDAFGKRTQTTSNDSVEDVDGYTGHEHLDAVGLIHMNGRLYDPDLGRFTTVDPMIATVTDSQNFGPYSYVNNQPFSLIDPSGYVACHNAGSGCVVRHVAGGRSDSGRPSAGFEEGRNLHYRGYPIFGTPAPSGSDAGLGGRGGFFPGRGTDNPGPAADDGSLVGYSVGSNGVIPLIDNRPLLAFDGGTNMQIYFQATNSDFWLNAGLEAGELVVVGFIPLGEAVKLAAEGDWEGAALSAGTEVATIVLTAGAGYVIIKGARGLHRVAVSRERASRALKDHGIPDTNRPRNVPVPNYCFIAGTQVMTPDGGRNIEDIEPGDTVYAYDQSNGKVVVRTVSNTYRNWAKNLIDISVDGHTVSSTLSHEFWLPERGEWVPATDLTVGSRLQTVDGLVSEVSSLSRVHGYVEVYNFEVEGEANYFVGEHGYLVHNGAGDDSFVDYDQARNAALKWLEARGFKAEIPTIGKFGDNAGKPIGMQTADKKIGFRVEFDQRSGAHINVWAAKEKGPHFLFEGTQSQVNQIVKRFFCD